MTKIRDFKPNIQSQNNTISCSIRGRFKPGDQDPLDGIHHLVRKSWFSFLRCQFLFFHQIRFATLSATNQYSSVPAANCCFSFRHHFEEALRFPRPLDCFRNPPAPQSTTTQREHHFTYCTLLCHSGRIGNHIYHPNFYSIVDSPLRHTIQEALWDSAVPPCPRFRLNGWCCSLRSTTWVMQLQITQMCSAISPLESL